MPITVACAHCGRDFTTINRKSKPRQKYCSKKCYAEAWKGPHPELYKLPDITCPQCGKTFHPRGKDKKFCSRGCATSWNWNPEQRGQGPTRTVQCASCGKPFQRKSKGNKYCSHECYAKANRGDANWKFNGYTTQDDRGYIYFTANHPNYPGRTYHNVLWHQHNPGVPCADCGNEVEHVHHIDGDTTNNDLENLVGLCNSCHMRRHAKETRFWEHRTNL